MNAFPTTVEYIDEENGEMVTETIVIDDFPYQESERFQPYQPEPDYSECPW